MSPPPFLPKFRISPLQIIGHFMGAYRMLIQNPLNRCLGRSLQTIMPRFRSILAGMIRQGATRPCLSYIAIIRAILFAFCTGKNNPCPKSQCLSSLSSSNPSIQSFSFIVVQVERRDWTTQYIRSGPPPHRLPERIWYPSLPLCMPIPRTGRPRRSSYPYEIEARVELPG